MCMKIFPDCVVTFVLPCKHVITDNVYPVKMMFFLSSVLVQKDLLLESFYFIFPTLGPPYKNCFTYLTSFVLTSSLPSAQVIHKVYYSWVMVALGNT